MSKRFIIDGNGPGRVMVIDAEKADALMEYILQEGGNPYEITKAKATSFVFEGWDECGETVYWSISHCEWFDPKKEVAKFDMPEQDIWEKYVEEEYDDDEPPIRKSKKLRGGGWVPLIARG